MTFKKNGTDPGFDMRVTLPGLPGGAAWPAWVQQAAKAVQDYVQAALEPRQPAAFYDGFRYRRSGRGTGPTNRKRRSNMLHISKRVRRKHRRAKCSS